MTGIADLKAFTRETNSTLECQTLAYDLRYENFLRTNNVQDKPYQTQTNYYHDEWSITPISVL